MPAAGSSPAAGGALGPALVAAVLVIDAVVMFMFPLFSAPRSRGIDAAPVAYLQAHLGTYRFFSTGADYANPGGPVTPNYGSYFAIASVDHFDIPVPKSWVDYVHASLDPGAGPLFFTGTEFGRVAPAPTPVAELAGHLAGFERLGVRYVVSGAASSGALEKALPRARVVFRDPYAVIVQLPAADPYFSVAGGPCAVRAVSREEAVVSCRRPATLVRRELAYPGWQAAVNGRPVRLSAAGPLFMGVALAKGRSVVTFGYGPPGVADGELLALAALLILLAPVVVARARSLRARRGRARPLPAGCTPTEGRRIGPPAVGLSVRRGSARWRERRVAEVEIGIGKSGRRGYGFDDIAIVPSRRTRDPEDVDISWEIDAFSFELPLMAAAMDGVVCPAIAIEIGRLGGVGVLNLEGLWTRYEDPEPLLEEIAGLDADKATRAHAADLQRADQDRARRPSGSARSRRPGSSPAPR